jgi:hypothetical protein
VKDAIDTTLKAPTSDARKLERFNLTTTLPGFRC